jgi:C-terminal peptidase prc
MRFNTVLFTLLAGLTLTPGAEPLQAPAPADKPRVAPLAPGEAQNYANQIFSAINVIPSRYVREVTPQRLAAAALIGLAEEAGGKLPDHLQGDLDKVEKALADRNLLTELAAARTALGDVEALRGDNAIRISLQSLTRALDAHSTYLSAREYRLMQETRGFHAGVGLTLEERAHRMEPLFVRAVVLDSPPQKAGIRPGDEVLEIEGQPVRTLSNADLYEKLYVDVDAEVTLTVRRDGENEPRKIKYARELFRETTILGMDRAGGWNYLLDRKRQIAYVRVTTLANETSGELQVVLKALEEDGVKGLILDLRDCPGGYRSTALHVADLFLDEGVLAIMKQRADPNLGKVPPEEMSATRGGFLKAPMVALVGPETSGGGELIAAALQDHRRAVIAGQRTRGKASVQDILGLGGNHAFRITTGYFDRPTGKNLQRWPDSKRSDDWGVRPDPNLEVITSPILRRQLRAWRLRHDLRDTDSRELLPLDDLERDPVLFRALEYLRKLDK